MTMSVIFLHFWMQLESPGLSTEIESRRSDTRGIYTDKIVKFDLNGLLWAPVKRRADVHYLHSSAVSTQSPR